MMNKRSVVLTSFVSIMLLTVLGCSGSPTKDTPEEGSSAGTPSQETPSMEGQADPLPDAGSETAAVGSGDPAPLTDATPTPDASASPLPDAAVASDGTATPGTEPSPAPSDAVEVASTTTTTETKTETVSAEPPAATMDAGSEPYTVRRGDTLMKIAFRKYGSVAKWKEIFDANKGVLKSANQLEPGTQLTLQGPFDLPKKPSGQRYTILPGDTLAKIAEKLYGTSSKWRMLWKHNRSIIPNPNRIYAGFFLYYKNGTQPASAQSMKESPMSGDAQAIAPAAPAMTPPAPESTMPAQTAAPVPAPAAGDFGAMSQMLNAAKPN